MSFVSIWKACSIVLTGAFGILGLLTEFKEKHTNRITKWGRISLIGIIVTTVLGVAAQLKESADNGKQELALLTDLRRNLSPLVVPKVHAKFRFDCTNEALAKEWVCKDLPAPHQYQFLFTMAFFSDEKTLDFDTQRGNSFGDLSYFVKGGVVQSREGNVITLEMTNGTVEIKGNSLPRKSVLDLLNIPVLVSCGGHTPCRVDWVYLAFPQSECIGSFSFMPVVRSSSLPKGSDHDVFVGNWSQLSKDASCF